MRADRKREVIELVRKSPWPKRRTLEELGYIRKSGDRWELTPKAVRRLADKALREVFGSLSRANLGGHGRCFVTPTAGLGQLGRTE